MNGSYEALKGGQSSEALEDFTGGMCLSVPMSNPPKNLFPLMLKSSKFKSLMCSAIDARSAAEIEAKMSNGLVKGHAYTISNVASVRLYLQLHCIFFLSEQRQNQGCKCISILEGCTFSKDQSCAIRDRILQNSSCRKFKKDSIFSMTGKKAIVQVQSKMGTDFIAIN